MPFSRAAQPWLQGTNPLLKGAKPWLHGLRWFATPPLHVCHGAVARLPCRRGTSATAPWQTIWPHFVTEICLAEMVIRLSVSVRCIFSFPQASCERINAHYAARSAVLNGDIFCQPRLVVKFPILRAFAWHACRVIVNFASDKEVLHTPSLPLAKQGRRDNKEKNL